MKLFGMAMVGISVIVGGLLAGCRDRSASIDLALTRRPLPGFSLELPRGVEKVAQLDYAPGKLRVEKLGGGEGLLAVYWMFGQVVDEAAALEIARAAARSDGLAPEGAELIERKPDRTTIIAIDAARMKLQSFAQCGARTISLATYSVAESVHRTILGSLRCEPDPASERVATTIPIAIDLPEFAAIQRTPSMLALVSATSTVMLRQQTTTSLTLEFVERNSAVLFKGMQLDAQAQPRRGVVLPFVANVEGSQEWGVLRPIDCGASNMLVIALSGDTASAADLERRVSAARCLNVGESPPTWPDAPPEPAVP